MDEDQAWLDYRSSFAKVYDSANYSDSLQSWTMNASHHSLEKKFGGKAYFPRVLEIGAGTGEHLNYVNHKFDSYVMTDLDPETLKIAEQKIGGQFQGKVSYELESASKLSYMNDHFDRMIASHVLEHLYHPHLVIKEWKRVMKNGGVISILIPTDPGIAWRLGRHFGPRKKAVNQGLPYDYIMAREHVNACNNLVALLRFYFPNSFESWWPTYLPSMDINLFYIFHAVVVKD